MVLNGALTEASMCYCSKAAFLIACLVSCYYIKAKGRGARGAEMAGAVLLCLLSCASAALASGAKANVWGIIICLAICLMVTLYMSRQKRKNSKMHKRRKK